MIKISLNMLSFESSLYRISFVFFVFIFSCSQEKNTTICSYTNNGYIVSVLEINKTSAAAFAPQYIQVKIESLKSGQDYFLSEEIEIHNDGVNLFCEKNFQLQWVSEEQFYLSINGEEQSLEKYLFQIKSPLSKSEVKEF
ncbi:hypothetical protein [Flavivirga algicola]|uniref:Uncharacterized protein n=1 Tax=Flavivirga algicola TaxID=2729136 RepID=A0ABX1RS85_9FLAO|nr:hypothetical protein [Flavivirga algicola]NMH86031.1 hypothetical protein [Flavivirga algicola]